MTLSYTTNAQQRYLRLPFPEELTLILAIPAFELPTAQARSVLPAEVSRADAVFNCSRTALFLYALQTRRYDLLATAMDDRLHQPYRAALVPGMTAAMTAAYAAGALGVALSGAGPTLLAIAQENIAAVAASLHDAFQSHGIACQTPPPARRYHRRDGPTSAPQTRGTIVIPRQCARRETSYHHAGCGYPARRASPESYE